jgi:hypothetical protein
VDCYCLIHDPAAGHWIPFSLWPDQVHSLQTIHHHDLTVILKARQLGFSWLVVCYTLWLMLFRPAATVLLFSKRDDEATELLTFRLKGVYQRLPAWLQGTVVADSAHQWMLANGSRAMAFPVTGGRSYTGSLVIIDEADYVPDLEVLLSAVKPTIDAGGKLVLISTVDKSKPLSTFKRIYEKSKLGANDYQALFSSWRSRPGRDAAWYERQRRDVLARTGALDDLHQEYPATITEALAPRVLDKRLAPAWLEQCYQQGQAISSLQLPPQAPSIPGLVVYRLPQNDPSKEPGRYVIGADPAEGNPTSDDSALTVLDADTGEEVACLAGKLQPSTFGQHIDSIGCWYNQAAVMVERNNHGHAVLLYLEQSSVLWRLEGHDDKIGWLSNLKGKALLYDGCADAFRNGETLLHSLATFTQLASMEGASLRAPEGLPDDRADSYALAVQGLLALRSKGGSYGAGPAEDSFMAKFPPGMFANNSELSLAEQLEHMRF